MIHFKEYVPGFVEKEPEEYDTETLDEILEKNKRFVDPMNPGFIWARNDSHQLMISSKNKSEWWVIGFVHGIDLSEHLPHYRSCYTISGNDVKIVRSLKTGSLYIVEETSVYPDGHESYSVINLADSDDSWAWAEEGLDVEFVRFATQEEIDYANKCRAEEY